ncbi:MAG TPA: tetratricopeptide repeat protein [Polyangia bacterium]|nr:tetratricopeptide repeat protein [Polyangia bacterium]
MPKRRLSKKELKRPDQFVDFWTRTSEALANYAASHMRAIVVSLTALATVIAGSIAISQVSERRSVRAGEALAKAERIANVEPPLPGSPPPDDGLPHLPTAKEQVEAALKDLDAAFPPAGRGPLHAEAMVVRGSLLLDLDRAAEAATTYQGLLPDNLDSRLRFLAHEGLGYAYERLGKLPEAQAAFAELGKDSAGMDGFYKDRALYHQARLAELQSNPADAKRIYHEVLDKNPATSLREEITDRLAALEMK